MVKKCNIMSGGTSNMRMRPKKNRDVRLEKVSYLFAAKNEDKLDLDASFEDRSGDFLLEIGCGKGSFACGMSKKRPDARILALEKVTDVMMMAMEKASREECRNIRFDNIDAMNIDEYLPEHCIDAMYLNFSDPWPKKRNAKRRLTSPIFLEKYKKILKPGARIYFKTDNIGLFEYSLETFPECGYTLENVIFDLHSSPMNEDNIETEYERNFSAKGFKINYLEAFLK